MTFQNFRRAHPNVAIVGATGAVGVELIQCLEARDFPVSRLKLLASPRSAGQSLPFQGREVVVQALGLDSFAGASFHSARWDHSVTIAGKRVGIIGTGSTACQIVGAGRTRDRQVGEMPVIDQRRHARQDRRVRSARVPISAKVVADMMSAGGPPRNTVTGSGSIPAGNPPAGFGGGNAVVRLSENLLGLAYAWKF